jgi:hypothetical protein
VNLKTKKIVKCTNCECMIDIGETVSTPSEDALNTGHALCSKCTPVEVVKPIKPTKAE